MKPTECPDATRKNPVGAKILLSVMILDQKTAISEKNLEKDLKLIHQNEPEWMEVLLKKLERK